MATLDKAERRIAAGGALPSSCELDPLAALAALLGMPPRPSAGAAPYRRAASTSFRAARDGIRPPAHPASGSPLPPRMTADPTSSLQAAEGRSLEPNVTSLAERRAALRRETAAIAEPPAMLSANTLLRPAALDDARRTNASRDTAPPRHGAATASRRPQGASGALSEMAEALREAGRAAPARRRSDETPARQASRRSSHNVGDGRGGRIRDADLHRSSGAAPRPDASGQTAGGSVHHSDPEDPLHVPDVDANIAPAGPRGAEHGPIAPSAPRSPAARLDDEDDVLREAAWRNGVDLT